MRAKNAFDDDDAQPAAAKPSTPPNQFKWADRAGGRELAKLAAKLTVVGRKNSPERMEYLCRRIELFPNVSQAVAFAGISVSTLKYWLAKSEKGRPGDGFDLELDDRKGRFHEHWREALDSGVQLVEDSFVDRALNGYYETLSDKGRVQYQYDKDLINLGLTGPDAYLLDEEGRPIPERIHLQDPDVMQAVLKAFRRDRWGQHDKLDVTHRGGVMVVTAPALSSKELEEREKRHTEAPIEVEFREVEPE